MKLFNTLTRKIGEFTPIKNSEVGIYSCGPTVYDFAHIGNLRTYVFNDILRRSLEYLNYKVTHITNLTDVDDKTIKGSQKEGIALQEYTKRFIEYFFSDLKSLNILTPTVTPKATEHIPEMISLIQKLLDNGLAYKGEDGSIYFEINKFKDYGKLSGFDLKGLKAGVRVAKDEYDKENVSDFALWKAHFPEDGNVFWEAPFGKGRPGWHIECSAMSTKYLGENFDIHTGGVDLIFPHHENEIAQTEGTTGKPGWVKFWVHTEHLLVDNEKMSKSKGNFYRLKDIIDKGFNPLALRYLFLTAHYRQKLNFTWESLEAAQTALERLYEIVNKIRNNHAKSVGLNLPDLPGLAGLDLNKKWQAQFVEAISSDLNMPQAIATVWEMLKSDLEDKVKYGLLLDWDRVLGLKLEDGSEKLEAAHLRQGYGGQGSEIKELLDKRETLRKAKKWEEADEVRKEIEELGWILEDKQGGPNIIQKSKIKT